MDRFGGGTPANPLGGVLFAVEATELGVLGVGRFLRLTRLPEISTGGSSAGHRAPLRLTYGPGPMT
ncbi:hypothetical protein ACWGK6_08215 [Streptomyces violaceusniger]